MANPFAKLSRLQWRILWTLVDREVAHGGSPYVPAAARVDVFLERITESERVATLRMMSSLIRRGLVARIDREGERPAYKLAVDVRTVLREAYATDDPKMPVWHLREALDETERRRESDRRRRENRATMAAALARLRRLGIRGLRVEESP